MVTSFPGDDGFDLDHAVGAGPGPQVGDDLRTDAGRALAEVHHADDPAAAGNRDRLPGDGLAEDIARKHGADVATNRRTRPLP